MATLYVTSTETFVGKSAVCIALLRRMRQDGFAIGYMKPISISATHLSGSVKDEDSTSICELLGLDTPTEHVSPVSITPTLIEQILKGDSLSFIESLRQAYDAVGANKDIVVMEGTNSWAEGSLINLPPDTVIDLFDAAGLLISRYHTIRAIDTILTAKRYVGDHLKGVLLNQVEQPQLEYVKSRVIPFLESKNIPVFGVLPHERFLASVTVAELLEHLGGQLIGSREWCEKRVESLMVGAMGSEASLSHFRRRPNKAIITGGDRVDIQLVALETSTTALVLTSNFRPPLNVLDRAEERKVPIIVVPDDTLSAVERTEELFGHVRFHHHAKLSRFTELMNEHFNYQRLYDALGMRR